MIRDAQIESISLAVIGKRRGLVARSNVCRVQSKAAALRVGRGTDCMTRPQSLPRLD